MLLCSLFQSKRAHFILCLARWARFFEVSYKYALYKSTVILICNALTGSLGMQLNKPPATLKYRYVSTLFD